MALETGTYIDDLVATNPLGADNISDGDGHIRLLKSTIQASFPNITGAMTATQDDINDITTQIPTWVAKQECDTETTVEFDSIPSWVNRITMYFDGVSSDGNNNYLIQIGDASAWVTSGYDTSRCARLGTGANDLVSSSAGFVVNNNGTGQVHEGRVVLERTEANGNEWVYSGTLNRSDSAFVQVSSGRHQHSAALTRVRLSFNGDTGDAGEVSLRYER